MLAYDSMSSGVVVRVWLPRSRLLDRRYPSAIRAWAVAAWGQYVYQALRALFGTRLLVILAVVTTGCAEHDWVVREPSSAPAAPGSGLLAGAAEVDITPPPGAPLFGYSWGAARNAKGYWTRLKARALVLQDSRGERLALVQADLGAISGLLQREVAARTAGAGISTDRLMLAATHTHAAPGGYFGEKFFNYFGSGATGFDPRLVEMLATRIAQVVANAVANLERAALGVREIDVYGVTRNRSRGARENDFACPCLANRTNEVDHTLRLLRVDRLTQDRSEPMAALFVFAVHGTSLPSSNDLYHGDLHAVAARSLAWRIAASHPGLPPVMAAFMNGTEGDVSPAYATQTRNESIRLGSRIAAAAHEAFESLAGKLDPNPELSHAYREIVLPDTLTSDGPTCHEATIGIPTLGGAEDGRSFLYGKFGINEGRRRDEPAGCQSYKLPALALAQLLAMPQPHTPGQSIWSFFEGNADPGSFPRIAPLQVIRLGPHLMLATVPGEPTTELGRQIRWGEGATAGDAGNGSAKLSSGLSRAGLAQVASQIQLGVGSVAVVGLANEYLYYFTTPGEYRSQQYEGGSTLYGPLQGVALHEQLLGAVRSLGLPSAQLYYGERKFQPGASTQFWSAGDACHPEQWHALSTNVQPRTPTTPLVVSLNYIGASDGQDCGGYPATQVVCSGSPLVGPEGAIENDEGFRFEIRRVTGDTWSATWSAPAELANQRHCHLEVRRPGGTPVQSKEFEL
jgi:neutral ceramidase